MTVKLSTKVKKNQSAPRLWEQRTLTPYQSSTHSNIIPRWLIAYRSRSHTVLQYQTSHSRTIYTYSLPDPLFGGRRRLVSVGFEGFFLGQWVRGRLCCRKISDSLFWLYYFTPRWLAGVMPCPKKVQKKYAKRKDRNR